MKRALLAALLLLTLVPLAAFAELGIGGAAFFNSPYLLGQDVDKDQLSVNKFTFGGDVRLRISLFQGEALVLYSASEAVQSLDIFLDAGVAFDILMFRLSAGVGPNFTYNIGESSPLDNGFNFKLNGDVKLGKKISLGLSYIMDLNLDGGIDVDTSAGLLGATVLYWM